MAGHDRPGQNYRPGDRRQMAEMCFQKAPSQDLAKNGRFLTSPEKKFNSRRRGRQMAEMCFQKARPGFGQKRPFPNDPRRENEKSQGGN